MKDELEISDGFRDRMMMSGEEFLEAISNSKTTNMGLKEKAEALIKKISWTTNADKAKAEELMQEFLTYLMSNYVIQAGDTQFQIVEAEAYLNCKQHPDVYTHGTFKDGKVQDGPQTRMLEWYIHGSGMDLCLGNENAHFGVLIRSVKESSEDEKWDGVTGGPINARQRVFDCANEGQGKLVLSLVPQVVKFYYEGPWFIKRQGLNRKEEVKRLQNQWGVSKALGFHDANYRALAVGSPEITMAEKAKCVQKAYQAGQIDKDFAQSFYKDKLKYLPQ